MLKHIFGPISKMLKPLPTDWEKFSRQLENPAKYLNPSFVEKFQKYRRDPVRSDALSSYAGASHGLAVGLLHVEKDRVVFHTKDEKGEYRCWKWASSVDGVAALKARNGISVGPKSADFIMNEIAINCFRDSSNAAPVASAEYMAVQRALSAYNLTAPIFQRRDPELKFGITS